MLLVAIRQIPHFKISHDSRTVIRPFDKIDMTLDQGRNPRGTVKNWQIKVAFLLGKSVATCPAALSMFIA